jgi:hypothetical protein
MTLETPRNNKDMALPLLIDLRGYIEDIKNGMEGVAYADTGDLMEALDSLFGGDSWYQELLPLRRGASVKIMAGDKSAIAVVEKWVDQVEAKLG